MLPLYLTGTYQALAPPPSLCLFDWFLFALAELAVESLGVPHLLSSITRYHFVPFFSLGLLIDSLKP